MNNAGIKKLNTVFQRRKYPRNLAILKKLLSLEKRAWGAIDRSISAEMKSDDNQTLKWNSSLFYVL